jgi:DHH family
MHVTLAVPDLLALSPEAAVALPSLSRLGQYAGPPVMQRGGLDLLLLREHHGAAPAPLAALGAGLDPGASFVLRADPVSLIAGRDDVALAARIDDLDAAEAAALVATLNAHFAGDGLAFHAPRSDAWFVLVGAAPKLTTTPLAAVRGAIYPFLPGDSDAPQWRRWMSEMQMLLYEHPVNAAREARGRVPVTGIWIADGGRVRRRRARHGESPRQRRAHTAAAIRRAARERSRTGGVRSRGHDRRFAFRRGLAASGARRAGTKCPRVADPACRWRWQRGRMARDSSGVAATLAGKARAAPVAVAVARNGWRMSVAILRRTVPSAAQALIDGGMPAVLARIYAARGIASSGELDHRFAALPRHDTLLGIDAAAQRLVKAIAAREKIVIVADYDADGATACAVGLRGLAAMGASVDFIVPNRFEFGYGLTPEIVALAATLRPRLLVTVDNGIASVEGVAAAAARGIDVLITDHHLPGDTLPSPAIIVNPNQPRCTFPSKHIAGVGVMFYVLLATRALLREQRAFADRPEPNLADLTDLVALGTVADVVRLDQVNRIFVEQGLARIRAGRAQPGVLALFAVAGRASMPRDAWPTCRSASAAFWRRPTTRRWRWPASSTG